MTSFNWKRKNHLSTTSAAAFSREGDEGEEESAWEKEGIDWLTAAKRRRLILLEDNKTKSKRLGMTFHVKIQHLILCGCRLQEEGGVLAENERYWEAIKYWDEALQLTPNSAVLQEMKAQVLEI